MNKQTQRKILVITTGGTIGALPYPDPENPPKDCSMPDNDVVGEWLVNNGKDVRVIPFERVDSKHIDDDYRQRMMDTINADPAEAVIIVHGTDTITQTADFFSMKECNKPIVLTGAMTPLLNGYESDGHGNLNTALKVAQNGPNGVYIVLSDWYGKYQWTPYVYANQVGRWEKEYRSNGRYCHLVLKDKQDIERGITPQRDYPWDLPAPQDTL